MVEMELKTLKSELQEAHLEANTAKEQSSRIPVDTFFS